MTEDELEAVVAAEIEEAASFIDTEIGPLRAEAMRYYRGEPFGDEELGRSHYVSRDVADAIGAVLPSLMRIFFAGETVCEFVPRCAEDEALAAQQTDYCNHILTRDNDGHEVIMAAIKDALRAKLGIVKYWWDDALEVSTRRYTGLDLDGLTALMEELSQAQEAEIVEQGEDEHGLSVTLKLKRRRDRVAIEAVPPEEFLINREARSLDTARIVAHRREVTVSELVAMGYEREVVEAHLGEDLELSSSAERLARTAWSDTGFAGGASADATTRRVQYVEAYLTVDHDGDGIAELRRVCCIGPGRKILHHEPVDERPFAAFLCDPEPHAFFGDSLADKVMDIQRLKSQLMRAGMDSMMSTIFPRPVVTSGVDADDLLNNEVGSLIRVARQDDLRFESPPPVSEQALSWVGAVDAVREDRTGLSRVSMGLDAEALQNTTATAAEGQFTRSQERIELIARTMASGMRRLFRGISGLVAANQRKARTVRLRNRWVTIDPRAWRTDMDVTPTVALGGGSEQERAAKLSLIIGRQEMLLKEGAPLVSLKQYYDALARFVELAGFRNPGAFFRDPAGEDVAAEMAARASTPPAADPKVQALELEHRLAMARLQGEMALKREQLALEAQLRREQIAMEMGLKGPAVELGGAVG